MATYTIELRRICEIFTREEVENWFKDYNIEDYLTSEEIQNIVDKGLWSKEKLAKKIIDHYYMREIGFETPYLFKLNAKIKMQEIMEDYLPLIYSNSIKFDPLVNVDFTETFERKIKGTTENEGNLKSNGKSTSNSNSSGDNLSINNNTPQTRINKQDINSGIYASQVNQNETNNTINDTTTTENNNTSTNNGSSNQIENYTKKTKGNSGVSATAQALILQYRQTIRAIDREIINNLNDLFMGLY